MKKEVYLTILFDYYEELFTEKQRDYFKNYYFENLSLGEIAESNNISRNAIFKQIKIVEKKLEEYEDVLHCYEKDEKIRNIINNCSDNNIKIKLEDLLK